MKQPDQIIPFQGAPRKDYKNITGQKFGRFTAIELAGYRYQRGGNRELYWKCVCECGEIRFIRTGALTSGDATSCGRHYSEIVTKQMAAVGTRRITSLPEYSILAHMIGRCHNPKDAAYIGYGGRGIKVCDRWRFGEGGKNGFECFFEDMGARHSNKHSIDRINNNGDYCKANCRWTTQTEQCRNTRKNRTATLNGETMCLSGWDERLGLKQGTVSRRIGIGWDERRAITEPKTKRTITFQGISLNIVGWAKKLGWRPSVLYQRLDAGWPIERALTEPPNNIMPPSASPSTLTTRP